MKNFQFFHGKKNTLRFRDAAADTVFLHKIF